MTILSTVDIRSRPFVVLKDVSSPHCKSRLQRRESILRVTSLERELTLAQRFFQLIND